MDGLIHISQIADHRVEKPEDELSEGQAWALVEKATRNGGYGYKEEFDKLPPIVQKAVGSPSQIHEWAMMDSDTVKSVVASNFMRSYKIMLKREKEMALIPVDVQVDAPWLTGRAGTAASGQTPATTPARRIWSGRRWTWR